MTTVVLFPSVLGVRPGIHAAVELLQSHGHQVRVVDLNGGTVFDEYEPAMAFSQKQDLPTLRQQALDAVSELPDGFVTAGFSNGTLMAQYVACSRPGAVGAVRFSGVAVPKALGVPWPLGLPAQVHYTVGDPFDEKEWIDQSVQAIRDAGGEVERYDYPGDGHLFTDSSLPEYQPEQAAELWSRVLEFLTRAASRAAG